MRKRSTRTMLGLALAGVAATASAGCGAAWDEVSERAEAARVVATHVTTVTPERATLRRTTSQPGQIEAFEVAALRAKVAGYVESVAVDIGDKVKKGEVLAVLSMPEVVAELEQKRALIQQAEADRRQAESAVRVAEAAVISAEAKVTAAKAGIRRTEADVARWQAEFNRIEQLVRESAITESLLDETRSKLQAAQASGDEVKAQVKSAEAARAQAAAELDKAHSDVASAAARVEVAKADARQTEAMLGYTKIEAPFDGVVTRRNFDAGHLTAPGASSEPLFDLERSDIVTITLGVPETDAPFVNQGDPAQIRLQALVNKTFEGTVTRTAWALDSATRTLRVEVDIPNPEATLRPGLYAYVTVTAEEHENVLTVPTSAIVKDGDQTFCVTVTDSRATRREVKTGLVEGKRTEILSGLDGDEAVVEANAGSLTDGQLVEKTTPETTPKS